jgi:hypothetical protein
MQKHLPQEKLYEFSDATLATDTINFDRNTQSFLQYQGTIVNRKHISKQGGNII